MSSLTTSGALVRGITDPTLLTHWRIGLANGTYVPKYDNVNDLFRVYSGALTKIDYHKLKAYHNFAVSMACAYIGALSWSVPFQLSIFVLNLIVGNYWVCLLPVVGAGLTGYIIYRPLSGHLDVLRVTTRYIPLSSKG